MLRKLYFKPSTYRTLEIVGKLDIWMISLPKIEVVAPSLKVTVLPFQLSEVENNVLFPYICLAHALS